MPLVVEVNKQMKSCPSVVGSQVKCNKVKLNKQKLNFLR